MEIKVTSLTWDGPKLTVECEDGMTLVFPNAELRVDSGGIGQNELVLTILAKKPEKY